MDSQLNTTFEAIKESMNLKFQKPLCNLAPRSNHNNLSESTSARGEGGGGLHVISTGSLSSRLNNLQQAFKEDIESTKPFREFKTLYSTKCYENDDTSHTSFKPELRKCFNAENTENDNDVASVNTPRSISGSILKSKYSFTDDSPLSSSKISVLNSAKKNCFEDDDDDKFANSTKISAILMNDYSPSSNHVNMNFIMLIGFVAGLLISKVFQYIELYLNWLLVQVLQFRNNLMGTMSLWIFLNFDDTRHLPVRSKLLLLPLVAACSLIYCLIYVLCFLVRFLLTAAPNGLIKFVQNLHK